MKTLNYPQFFIKLPPKMTVIAINVMTYPFVSNSYDFLLSFE